MYPTELNSIGEDLHVVLHFLVCGLRQTFQFLKEDLTHFFGLIFTFLGRKSTS